MTEADGRAPRGAGATDRHVWVDGRLLPADGLHLSVFDRGFQLGDGIFETLRVRGGRPTELAEHTARLRNSAAGLDIPLPDDIAERLATGIADLLAADGLDGADGDASVRITVSRGAFQARGLLPPDEVVAATIAIQAWPVVPAPAAHLERGLHLVASAVRRDPANPLVALKTTSRADYVFARLEARRAGADDALFLTIDDQLSEGTTANIFLVRRAADGAVELATPSLDCAILPGHDPIVAAGLGRAGRPARRSRARLTRADLAAADEAFLSSSVAGVLPVTRFEGEPIGDGPPGPWTRRARADREALIAGGASTAGPRRGRARDRWRSRAPSRTTRRPDRRGSAMTRDELIAGTRQLVDEGDRLRANPSLASMQMWLKRSDDLLATAWGSMDRYHLAWLMVGKPKAIVRGRPMTPDEEAAYVREVAEQKTAALRMSLEAVERGGMPFVGETGGVGPGRRGGRRPARDGRDATRRPGAGPVRPAARPGPRRTPGRGPPQGRRAPRPRRTQGAAPRPHAALTLPGQSSRLKTTRSSPSAS